MARGKGEAALAGFGRIARRPMEDDGQLTLLPSVVASLAADHRVSDGHRGALFLDARRSKDFAEGHVAGARSFPVWESEVVRERVGELVAQGRDPSLPVVLYCSGGDCGDSHMLAQTLFGAGFENLLVYRDGFPDWVKRGGAARTGGPA